MTVALAAAMARRAPAAGRGAISHAEGAHP